VTFTDTSRGARRAQLRAYARLGASRRVEIAYALSEEIRTIAIQGIRSRDLRLTPEEARSALLRRLLGESLFRAAFPEAPPPRAQ
jgi:hypothetical protein